VRTLPAALTNALREEGPEPLWLVHLETGGSPADLRYAAYDGDVVFGGSTWSARPVEVPDFALENHSEAPTIELRIANADGYFDTLIAAGITFGNRKVRIYRTDVSLVGASSALTDALTETYFVEGFTRVHGWVVFRLRSILAALEIEIPLRVVDRNTFPGIPDSTGLA
jgi:hypothetical protein